MEKERRAALSAVVAAVLLVGASIPAAANPWGGSMTCPGGTVVSARGTKVATGSITLNAAGRTFTDETRFAGTITLRGGSSSGSWGVTGSGATSGQGLCLTP